MAKMLPALGFLLHLLISNNNMLRVEAEVCESPSTLFHGLCFSDANCGEICIKEGFLSGHCKGIKLKCICYKDCDAPGKPPKQTPPKQPPHNPPPKVHPPKTPSPNPPTGCPNPPAGGCPNPPPCGSTNPPCPKPPSGCPKPPNPPTGCPNPPTNPGGCPNPPTNPCPKPPGGCKN